MNYLKKIFSPSLLVISFFLLIYTFYKSEIYWDGNKKDYFFSYYLISLILVFLSIITFFINHKLKQYLIITVISTVTTLYLFEAYLLFKQQNSKGQLSINNQNKEQIYENITGKKFDNRTRLEILKDFREINKKIQVTVSPNNYVNKNNPIFPLSGISNSKTIFCNENGFYTIYESDRYGFNNPDDNWDADEIEYLLVGDSFAHGACVNTPNDIGSVLRNLSKKSVLNLGYSGNGPLIEYATLREYFVKGTKNIVWIYYENDLNDLKREISSQILNKYLSDKDFSQNLILRQNEVNRANKELINNLYNINMELDSLKQHKKDMNKKNQVLKFIRFDSLKTLIKNFSTKKNFQENKLPFDYFSKILSEAKNFADMNKSNFYFVYMPSIKNFNSKNFENKNFQIIKDLINDLNIEFIDLNNDLFNNFRDPLKFYTFKIGPHLNVNGYKEAAFKIIESANLK